MQLQKEVKFNPRQPSCRDPPIMINIWYAALLKNFAYIIAFTDFEQSLLAFYREDYYILLEQPDPDISIRVIDCSIRVEHVDPFQ